MKQIIINNCVDCPHSKVDNDEDSDTFGNWTCSMIMTGHNKNLFPIYKIINNINIIPIWCELEEYKE
jgi:hypothetical protein